MTLKNVALLFSNAVLAFGSKENKFGRCLLTVWKTDIPQNDAAYFAVKAIYELYFASEKLFIFLLG